ncbi:GNAT family N-acetyltransferase [Bradyrhizobium frederickii]|uniref:GNAT family N-acetyltransferase n=1 Tax=Bradyrhizobium frederickii TaxID=2560054 RepID=UPI001F1D380E|nr:GNAT family N-acetyltransferase [Bradyrhizobium frederickii]
MSRGGRPYGVIENVVTHVDYRRLGLGRRVLAHALDVARQADCYKVHLATGSKREATLRFYEGAGFHRGARHTSKYAAPNGSVQADIISGWARAPLSLSNCLCCVPVLC